ncbi:hypothetical protein BDB01DRAFT_845608 [Pilobolus umbonatus]|nr:hypothetical protein BDB01DRAFT_845608 [Pilobolus umbonatus]
MHLSKYNYMTDGSSTRSLDIESTTWTPRNSFSSEYKRRSSYLSGSTRYSDSGEETPQLKIVTRRHSRGESLDPRDSRLMKQALKSLSRKRSESMGEVAATRKRPVSIAVLPRLSKSSISSKKMKREDTPEEDHWDPHIDSFELLRAKVTGITRSMQEFHVQELFHDEFIRTKEEDHVVRRKSCLSSSFQEDYLASPLAMSPNLTSLFATTHNLINSRLDELSQSPVDDHALEWRDQFLTLVSSCIQQSEELESLSTEVLNAEQKVRQFMLMGDSIHEQFQERERQYEERIRECQEVAQQQLLMIESLEELIADINMKIESYHRNQSKQLEDIQDNKMDEDENPRWNFRKSVGELLHMEEKLDIVQKMRWDVGMLVGGGVGTGHVIHTFENGLNGFDMMIAGTGTTHQPEDDVHSTLTTDIYYEPLTASHQISSSIQHLKLYQHHFVLHLNHRDRRTKFACLPKSLWIPDHETDHCQFRTRNSQCHTVFSLFQRRHHCRRCGYIMCQRHSANRLPLFTSTNSYSHGQWTRVCDNCFHELIIKP